MRVDPETMHPRGEPGAIQHYHGAQRSVASILSFLPLIHLSVGRERLLVNLDEFRLDAWMTVLN
jgi:hypothetical protein